MHRILVKYVELHCGFSFSTSYWSPDLLLTFVRIPVKQKWSAEYLIGVNCDEWMVGNNYTNNSLNEFFNCCLYLVLDWLDILGIICDTWCGLSESSLIFWSKSESYLQFYVPTIIVSQLVYSYLFFNHNSIYLVQLKLWCRW